MLSNSIKKTATKILLCLFIFIANNIKAANYYWVGGKGNWSDISNHWATTSGGVVFHTTIPSPSDDVFFDANSFQQTGDTVFLDSTIINCGSMNWNGAINNPVLQGIGMWGNNTLTVYGSLILNANMKWNLNGKIDLVSSIAGNTLNTNGLVLYDSLNYSEIDINGTGSWNLLSDLTTNNFLIYNGTFNSNNYTINAFILIQATAAINPVVLLGTSSINGSFYSYIYINADSANFNCSNFKANSGGVFNNVVSLQIEAIGATFNNAQCGKIYGDSNNFNNLQFLNWNCDYFTNSPCNYVGGSGNYFHKAIFPCSYLELEGNQKFDSLIFNNPGQIIKLHNDTITINNHLEIGGTCSGLTSIISPVDTATFLFSNGIFNFDFLLLQNINVSGNAAVTANNSIDAGGNSGWIINAPLPRALYWVGGKGNWNDATHWSAISGGIGGACVPNQYDSLFFDANSFLASGDTVFANAPFLNCRYMDWSAALNTPVFANSVPQSQLQVWGSFILNQNMIWKLSGSILLSSPLAGNVINTYGIDITSSYFIYIDDTGSWNLQNDLKVYNIYFKQGSFYTNNYNITGSMKSFYNGKNVSLFLGTSLISGGDFYFTQGTNIIIDGANASFNVGNFGSPNGITYNDVTCTGLSANSCSFHNVNCASITGNNNTFNKVTIDSIYGFSYVNGQNNVIQNFKIYSNNFLFGNGPNTSYTAGSLTLFAPANVIYFGAGSTLTINNQLNINGSCSGLVSLICNSGGAQIQKNNGSINFDYLYLKNISKTGGAIFTANNSIDAGGNNGWIINTPAPRQLYWVGGTGDINDISHWSTTSGGIGGSCIPNQFDDINFDANSFSSTDDTVYLNLNNFYFHTINCSAVTNFPTFYGASYNLNIFGSFILSSNMNWNVSGYIFFMSDSTGNVINTGNSLLTSLNIGSTIYFSGNGSWDLTSNFTAYRIRFENGTFRTNNYNLNVSSINPFSVNPINPTLFLGTSLINASEVNFNNNNTTIHADSCTFLSDYFTSTIGAMSYNEVHASTQLVANSCIFKYVSCSNFVGSGNLISDFKFTDYFSNSINGNNNVFHKVIMPANSCGIYGLNTFDTLIFNNPGQQIALDGIININNYLQIQSSPGFPTSLNGANGFATISKPTDTVCTDFVYISNIHTTGGAVFYAGDNSVDLGNNSGWIWSSCTPDTSNVWPGDANYDLIADNTDLLYIGLAYGYNGPVRANASNNWTAQPAVDWQQQFATGYNIKNADCDGNGMVNADDTLAVSLNYGLTHPFKLSTPPQPNNFGNDLYFDMPTSALVPGSVVSIPIMFGSAVYPTTNLYGMAFTINYDPTHIQAGTVQIDFTNSWLGTNLNTLHLTKDDYANGKIDMGFVRTDHQNVSGNGLFATLTFTVANNASGYLNLAFSKITALDKNEIPLPVNAVASSVYTSINETPALENLISVYPNPASSMITIHDPNTIIQQLKIVDRLGRVIYENESKSNAIKINVSAFTAGIYFLRIETTKGVLNKKMVINK